MGIYMSYLGGVTSKEKGGQDRALTHAVAAEILPLLS